MTTRISIEVPQQNSYTIRLGIEHENSANIEIKHLQPGEHWSGYIHAGMRIVEISEVKINDITIGRTHTARLASSA